MKTKVIIEIQSKMKPLLSYSQNSKLTKILLTCLSDVKIVEKKINMDLTDFNRNQNFLVMFLASKKVEGCSQKTLVYYESTINKLLNTLKKNIDNITTDDIRLYLANFKEEKNSSKITIDNIRRIFLSFFGWLEDEDYILKNPIRRIHRIKTGRVVKEVLSDENLEILRDNCKDIRDLAMVELLISTGIRVGELVNLDIEDIDFHERECIVFGKGESERQVYFDARCKIHLMEYINKRNDNNPALFVSLNKPHNRLGIGGVEKTLRKLGNKLNINKVHPHKFRRTLATNAIDKGMPIEQVQKLLGHVQIDTTMQYAMVNQNNVKIAHRKFIG
jgi:site-specific recombinase XerD